VPSAVSVPIACGGTVLEPGDIIVADDDGAVVVPIGMAGALLAKASEHAAWEEFSRERLAEGGDMRRYYRCTLAMVAIGDAARCRAIPTPRSWA
jgi:regulator of RNase E activity RraA